jgi:hypothetical protein
MTVWQGLSARLRADGDQPEPPTNDPWQRASAPAKVARRIGRCLFDVDAGPGLIEVVSVRLPLGVRAEDDPKTRATYLRRALMVEHGDEVPPRAGRQDRRTARAARLHSLASEDSSVASPATGGRQTTLEGAHPAARRSPVAAARALAARSAERRRVLQPPKGTVFGRLSSHAAAGRRPRPERREGGVRGGGAADATAGTARARSPARSLPVVS